MADRPQVILSSFGDEAANQKTAEQQFVALAALGLQYYSIRFIDVGNGVKNVMQLTRQEITKIRHLEDEYGLNVASIGSPIGKVKLLDTDDGTKNRFVIFVRSSCPLCYILLSIPIKTPARIYARGGRGFRRDRRSPSNRSRCRAPD